MSFFAIIILVNFFTELLKDDSMPYKQITADELKTMIQEKDVTIIDIRDPGAYGAGHIENAININDSNVEEFVQTTDKNKPLVACCYHGMSSQDAADYMSQQGFKETYSLIGGFSAWN